MALIKCGECGKDISRAAKNCPHCGWRGISGNGRGALKILGGFFFCFFVLPIVFVACFSSSRKPPAPVTSASSSSSSESGSPSARAEFAKSLHGISTDASITTYVSGASNEVLVCDASKFSGSCSEILDTDVQGLLRSMGFKHVVVFCEGQKRTMDL